MPSRFADHLEAAHDGIDGFFVVKERVVVETPGVPRNAIDAIRHVPDEGGDRLLDIHQIFLDPRPVARRDGPVRHHI
jgi:hypothetical protein